MARTTPTSTPLAPEDHVQIDWGEDFAASYQAAFPDQPNAVVSIGGALAGLTGILYASRWGFINPSNTGSGFEFQVIAAVVIGGVSINGGVGSVLGVVLGVLLLGCVSAALPLLGIPGTAQSAIYGAVIIIALLIDRSVRQRGIAVLAAQRARA